MFRVRTARSGSWDDPTKQVGSKRNSVHDRLVYPENHPWHKDQQAQSKAKPHKEVDDARQQDKRKVVVDLASEPRSHHDGYQREERRRPREHHANSRQVDDVVSRREDDRSEHHANSHRADDVVSRRENDRREHLVDPHRADNEVTRRIALLEK